MSDSKLAEALEVCAEEIERGEPWISREAASAIIRKHALAAHEKQQAAQKQTEQQAGEAVAVFSVMRNGKGETRFDFMPLDAAFEMEGGAYDLFTHPQQPLTRDQVKALMAECGYDQASPQERADFINGVRNAEKALGIGITKDTK